MHWLASQSSCVLTSLFLDCVVTLGLSPVCAGAGAGSAGAGTSSAGA